jgi:hypothetical protein
MTYGAAKSRLAKIRLISATVLAACVIPGQTVSGQAGQAQNAAPVPAAGNVSVPLDEFNRLTALAAQPPKPSIAPPVPYVLKSAQMNLQVNGESVAGTVTIEGEVLAQGEREVPLVRGLVVREARQAGRELPVAQRGGMFSALLPGAARFAVTLDAAMPLTIEPGKASFLLAAPQAGAVRVTLTIPGEHTQVNLSPGLITSRSSREGKTVIEAAVAPGQTAAVWWAARLSAPAAPAAPKEVRFLSDVKTLITVGEAELAVAALAEITVVQGEPAEFTIRAPEGYELTGATGSTLMASEMRKDSIVLSVGNASLRSHQFLISLARSNMSTKAEVPLITFEGTQKETGEVLVEGEGAMELTATERGVLRRMDLKEASPFLRSMARGTLHTAFRYQKKPGEAPEVALEWVRFPNGKMLSAVAQQAVVTTLVTSEGRSLTEVKLTLKNQSQPFLKVDLPAGASILTAEVAGEKVKPVLGADGSRVPLLRAGFRPTDAYMVSFVFLHAGAPFAKKGDAELVLPKMDLPIARVEWEVFLPDQYKVADFGGDALPARLLTLSSTNEEVPPQVIYAEAGRLGPGEVGGFISDPARAAVAGTLVVVRTLTSNVTWSAVTDRAGWWKVSNIPSGQLTVTASTPGFKTYTRVVNHDGGRSTEIPIALQVGATSESVTVTAEAALLKTESGVLAADVTRDSLSELPLSGIGVPRGSDAFSQLPQSRNVTDLQRRVVGVLPIAVNVPHTGTSYSFVRALAVDEETKLTFRYRTK